jgi:DNA-nicking Smr family endonuclease
VSKSKRELSGDEKKLWRRVAVSIKPRRPLALDAPSEEPTLKPPPAPPTRRAKPLTDDGDSAPALPRTHKPSAPPADRAGEKRVRRGKLEIGATLDLHGYNQQSAPAALARFLSAARARGETTVIVVTGVGRAGEGILKRRLPEWLAGGDVRPLVSGFAQAHRAHGGAGAFYVFLKRAR